MKTNNRFLVAVAGIVFFLSGCGGGGSKAPGDPPATAPSAPTGLAATAGNAQVSLSWSAVSGASSYKVKRSATAGGSYTEIQAGVTATNFTNTGLTNGTTYFYVVTAVNNVGESGNSNQASATPTAANQAPAAPTGLAASPGNAQVSLSWTASASATTYKVKRSTTTGGPYTDVQAGVTATNYTNTGLTNGTPYFYVVTAVNNIGESSNSNQVSATPVAPAQGAPTGLTATGGNGQVALSWNAVPGATRYYIYLGNSADAFDSSTSPSYTDMGLFNDLTYTYRVSAETSSGEGPKSNPESATPSGAGLPPAAPTALMAGFRDAGVALAWAAAPGATGYKVYRGGTVVGTTAETIFTDVGLTNGTAYSYQVSGTNTLGEGAKSNVASATPRADVPSGHNLGCAAFPAMPDQNCTGWRWLVGKTVTYADNQQRVFTALRTTGCAPSDQTAEAYYFYTDNATYEDCYFSKNLVIVGKNITIKRSQIHGLIGSHADYDYEGLTLIDVEIEQEGDPISKLTGAATGGANFTCRRCDVHHTVSGFHAGDNTTIEESFTHDFFFVEGTHGAGIGMGQGHGSNSRFIHNNIQCNRLPGQDQTCTSALSIYGESKAVGVARFAYVKNIQIEKNLFNTTGGYCFHAPSTAGTHIRAIDNLFGKQFYFKCASGNGQGGNTVRDFLVPYDPPVGAQPGDDRLCPFPQDASPKCTRGNQWTGNAWQDGSGTVPSVPL